MKRLLIVLALLFAMPTFADNLDEYILIVSRSCRLLAKATGATGLRGRDTFVVGAAMIDRSWQAMRPGHGLI